MMSLEVWIEQLRDGLKRGGGGFASRGPVTLRDGSRLPDTELAIRVMLADLDHLHALPVDDWLTLARRQDLLDDFRHLRAQLAS
jgi:hypothetical protein